MQSRAVLICNGSLDTKYLYQHILRSDFLIAVDGGANKLSKTSFVPNLLIGDMDSISKSALRKYRKVEMIKFPREKDMIDLELAINYCIERKFRQILILGALGSRADMTLTNVFLLADIPSKINARIIHETQEIFLVPRKFQISGVPGETISLFPIKGDVSGLTLHGFKYALENYNLRFGIGIGLSNEFKSKKARISFKDGLLVCVHFHKAF